MEYPQIHYELLRQVVYSVVCDCFAISLDGTLHADRAQRRRLEFEHLNGGRGGRLFGVGKSVLASWSEEGTFERVGECFQLFITYGALRMLYALLARRLFSKPVSTFKRPFRQVIK